MRHAQRVKGDSLSIVPAGRIVFGLSSEEILFLQIFPLIYSCSILTEWLCNSWFESCHTASQQAYIIYRVLYEEI